MTGYIGYEVPTLGRNYVDYLLLLVEIIGFLEMFLIPLPFIMLPNLLCSKMKPNSISHPLSSGHIFRSTRIPEHRVQLFQTQSP